MRETNTILKKNVLLSNFEKEARSLIPETSEEQVEDLIKRVVNDGTKKIHLQVNSEAYDDDNYWNIIEFEDGRLGISNLDTE